MSLRAGDQLDSLEILGPLGAGGMGEVYLARDRELNRSVAVKMLPPAVTSDPQRVARFEQEARAASALNHPNVCVIHALGRTEDGRRYIAMEHVEGKTLRARLVRGRLPLAEALDIAIQIASALTAAHAAGIVHRDIKPENVMIRRDRLVKVLDFGLAKLTPSSLSLAAHEPTRTVAMTEAGSLVGTVGDSLRPRARDSRRRAVRDHEVRYARIHPVARRDRDRDRDCSGPCAADDDDRDRQHLDARRRGSVAASGQLPTPTPKLKPRDVYPSTPTGVTFSPDGRSITYASGRAGNFDIRIQSVSGGEPRQLTKITRIEKRGGEIVVRYRERRPAPGDLVALGAHGSLSHRPGRIDTARVRFERAR